MFFILFIRTSTFTSFVGFVPSVISYLDGVCRFDLKHRRLIAKSLKVNSLICVSWWGIMFGLTFVVLSMSVIVFGFLLRHCIWYGLPLFGSSGS